MATRTITVHDRCTQCGKVLHSMREGESGQCASCWFAAMPKDTKKAMNRLIASAFNGASEVEKSQAVADALAKLRRDGGE